MWRNMRSRWSVIIWHVGYTLFATSLFRSFILCSFSQRLYSSFSPTYPSSLYAIVPPSDIQILKLKRQRVCKCVCTYTENNCYIPRNRNSTLVNVTFLHTLKLEVAPKKFHHYFIDNLIFSDTIISRATFKMEEKQI